MWLSNCELSWLLFLQNFEWNIQASNWICWLGFIGLYDKLIEAAVITRWKFSIKEFDFIKILGVVSQTWVYYLMNVGPRQSSEVYIVDDGIATVGYG